MKYGFVIDNRKCIGCHACSTACKSENEVPLGVDRTWVKYTETGQFPDVTRHFQVTRCNHCENAPCVRICPVSAMYQRDDGIVEFDKDICIGCKACIQACPYDAIHIDPDNGTAAKCHFCSHRVDIGLEPACVVVCPEHAIIAGDMDDPQSEISSYLAKEDVTVRKPEQGTAPKLFYVEGHTASMHPTAATFEENTAMFTDGKPGDLATSASQSYKPSQGLPPNGSVSMGGGRMAEQMIQVGFNAQHKTYWHWQVPAYVVTKDIACGLFMLMALALTRFESMGLIPLASAVVGLVFTLITTALLVIDLEKPMRFLSILYRPQWRSWITRGAFLLVSFSLLQTLVVGLEIAALWQPIGEALASWVGATESLLDVAMFAGVPLAGMTAIYTAFLFGQAEGRDLWQSPLLPIQFLVRTVLAGSAVMHALIALLPSGDIELSFTGYLLAGSLIVDLLLTFLGEFGMPHAHENAARAAKMITKGRYKWHFWLGFFALGHLVPLVLLTSTIGDASALLAGGSALVGLFVMEYIFIFAAQKIPNS